MDPDRLRELLDSVAERSVSIDEAMRELGELPFRALGFAHADTHRHLRTGFPEVVLGEGKTPTQIAAILNVLRAGHEEGGARVPVFATRVSAEAAPAVLAAVPGARYLPVPRAVVVGETPPPEHGRGV